MEQEDVGLETATPQGRELKLNSRDSSASNAARSPFLLLPPEARGLIYDHGFGSKVVHISEDTRFTCIGKVGYRLDVCLCTLDYEHPQRIIHLPLPKNPQASDRQYTQHDDCTRDGTRVPAGRGRAFPLQILHVCRQIHFEAALKPFSQTTFVIQERS